MLWYFTMVIAFPKIKFLLTNIFIYLIWFICHPTQRRLRAAYYKAHKAWNRNRPPKQHQNLNNLHTTHSCSPASQGTFSPPNASQSPTHIWVLCRQTPSSHIPQCAHVVDPLPLLLTQRTVLSSPMLSWTTYLTPFKEDCDCPPKPTDFSPCLPLLSSVEKQHKTWSSTNS